MIYEYRVYSCVPGQMPRLQKRFQDHTLPIWQRLGIRQAGFWTVAIGDGSNDLHYLLAWESLAEREQKWGAFMADAEWQKAKAESEAPGAIVANIKSTILQPTAFSSVK